MKRILPALALAAAFLAPTAHAQAPKANPWPSSA